MSQNSVRVQAQDFSVAVEYDALTAGNTDDGAVATFVGRMRDHNDNASVVSLWLEHYPGMTEKVLSELVTEARERWQLGRVSVVHRIGELQPGDQIVWVGVTSQHRADALSACDFLMDALKTRAPFWKKETTRDGERWLAPRSGDEQRDQRWRT